jgi:hypothetical protein
VMAASLQRSNRKRTTESAHRTRTALTFDSSEEDLLFGPINAPLIPILLMLFILSTHPKNRVSLDTRRLTAMLPGSDYGVFPGPRVIRIQARESERY